MELTEKEKALEIYHNHARRWHSTSEDIKYSALITVDEVLKSYNTKDLIYPKEVSYWNEVKKEINNL
jgi:hypothetical protein